MFLSELSALAALAIPGMALAQQGKMVLPSPMQHRTIPVSGEKIPAIGLGSWITFDASPEDRQRRAASLNVIDDFLELGGRMIDSSPMYGYAQDVIGRSLDEIGTKGEEFSATKVWIPGAYLGESQMNQALELWGLGKFDLIHIHNMLDWQSHLPWLRRWKESGKLRYIGITTSHGRRHSELAQVIRSEPDFDFVQFTYNMVDRDAEKELLPLALDNGKAVVINRPLRGGDLFRRVGNRPIPGWAEELGYTAWSQIFLGWIISHPAVCCPIPATSRPDHVRENMATLRLPVFSEDQRALALAAFLNG